MVSRKKTSESQKSRPFRLEASYKPAGDQPKVIQSTTQSLRDNRREQTILGATGTGKTYMMASIVEELQRPTLVIAHNKTLAAQLAEEFKSFFPDNAVHYFVSYYDYYQPESYLPRSDTYIEKQTQINEEIERLRNASTHSLLTRRDVLIVSSVSCIYGLGDPEDFRALQVVLEKGKVYKPQKIMRKLIDMQYVRTHLDLKRGMFRLRGDTLEIFPTSEENRAYRFSFFGDELEHIQSFHVITNDVLEDLDIYTAFPAKQYVTTQEKIKRAVDRIEQDMYTQVERFEKDGQLLQAQRIKERTLHDIEMLLTVGYCSGIENYSIYFDSREDGEPPTTLLDYFPDDALTFVDESHITLSQIAAMYSGDFSRKSTLVNYGFRLPSALNNRPLRINEFYEKVGQMVYVSATPGNFEYGKTNLISKNEVMHRTEHPEPITVSEAIIRPTGLLDPVIELRPVENQVDDVLEQVRQRVERGERVLITTLTKKFAEELDVYFKQISIKSAYIHSDVETLDRVQILSDLRRGKYDVLIGINLLREGLDLPEVSLVAIFDADKEGFLRSKTSLIQIIGRAARHVNGTVIMYADSVTDSMRYALDETERRRTIQQAYNIQNNITPQTTVRKLVTIVDELEREKEEDQDYGKAGAVYTPFGFQEVTEEVLKVREKQTTYKQNKSIHGPEQIRVTRIKKKQVYDDFESKKNQYLEQLEQQNASEEELNHQLEEAIKKMDFELAAAIRDLLNSD